MQDVFTQVGELTYAEAEERVNPAADSQMHVDPMGVIQPDDLHIFLTESILEEVVAYSNTDTSHELGGVFVGSLYQWKEKPWLLIEGYIKARQYRNTAASFTFTHDTWSGITREREQKWDDKLMIGWQHTHPGYGIFLSSMDQFIHNNFFNLPWMTALVVDPKQESLGFFQWKKGKIQPCGFFYIR